MSYLQIFKLPNIFFNAIPENLILVKISEFTVILYSLFKERKQGCIATQW